ncbi:MAG: M60 family metallopeptidase, partial [Planctomycetota bacterium]|nr:M60 family metallopeptidase [Planctomycetota bacterium]
MRIRCMIAVALAAASPAWGAAAGGVPTDGKDAEGLLAGVTQIAAPGVPGPLCVFGDKAVVIATGGAGKETRAPVVAAGRMGAGRVVAFGHDGYFDAATLAAGDTGRLMLNAIRWTAGAKTAPRVAVYRQAGLAGFLGKQGIQAAAIEGPGWQDKLKTFDVLCTRTTDLSIDADVAAVSAFVKVGGGLIAADLGWGWIQLHPGKDLATDHPGNRLLAEAGILWADGSLNRTADVGFAAGQVPSALTHAGRALDAVQAHADGKATLKPDDLGQAAWVLTHAARSLPPGDTLLAPRIRRLREARAAAAVPTPEKPLKADRPLDRLVLTLELEEARRLAPEKIRAHPAAAAFPGAVPADAPRIERTVHVDMAVPGWHSTGLYAPPGEVVTVTVPPALAARALGVRIGAHSDRLWGLNSWSRSPEVCVRLPIDGATTRAAGAFGGLIYVEVRGGSGQGGDAAVTIAGAVEAPHYVLGKTGAGEWRDKIRLRPAPWAELETGKVILTLP